MKHSQQYRDVLNVDPLHSACVVDENGREIPITRDMIRQSCEQLEKEGQQQEQHC